jgi:hypothetical protein
LDHQTLLGQASLTHEDKGPLAYVQVQLTQPINIFSYAPASPAGLSEDNGNSNFVQFLIHHVAKFFQSKKNEQHIFSIDLFLPRISS